MGCFVRLDQLDLCLTAPLCCVIHGSPACLQLVSGPMLRMACTGPVSDVLGYKISLVFINEIRQKYEEISEKEEQVGNNFEAKTFK